MPESRHRWMDESSISSVSTRRWSIRTRRSDQIYDLFAVRILVDTVKDCYAALGVIHEMYKPIPGQFQGLHCHAEAQYVPVPAYHTDRTQVDSHLRSRSVLIEMHKTAEYGIAAHWKYKESSDGKLPVDKREEEKLNWLRQILEWQKRHVR